MRKLLFAVLFLTACATPSTDEPPDAKREARGLSITALAHGVLLPVGGSAPPRQPEVRIARTPEDLGKLFQEHLEASQAGLSRKATNKLAAGERGLFVYLGRKPETAIQVSAIRARLDEEGTLHLTIHEEHEPGDARLEETHPFFLGRLGPFDEPPHRVKLRAVDGRPLKWEVWVDGAPR